MDQYIISTEAIRDMEQILDYLANTNINAGEKFLEEFSKKCRYLSQFPLMGRSYREIRPYLRGLPMKNYIIFYRLTEQGLEIMRVVKGERDLEAFFFENH
ncbi:type II toxin-antitoxin system RelE/ParE family toxin [Microcystis wesenbergii FACHB-1317]|jgi:toxin ParE1/3/4|uniref:type II toxin-antitoxin system RelE/ParE family toxin n=1 Tax=Microcystis TaxID=1125 RepID=UPI000E396AEC|nr:MULTISPECIES: type II toxin-antitoxin system RelE/ParE family toxin [Microcystis]MBD2288431.1 type II toxin-antitoxin system RelE/ParE family toxin [Microcystis wesenbergii FACHB-1317]REJ58008.1 MAG: type II toxin-antitoxin system RelE/ParE family toxin [Microcystis aeruginosa TA09]UZO78637.1 type II toxin-antitoxin system RelE/ParE family toxin [Microcystis aeruginosa str. Chao 1910]